ncbi:hypothetical protein UFOVP1304_59 [uncultured Caudovirales phage]|uniref:Uncharacterized protein n=1 Tax=uncultured Caudovirales phage TaxID=2100421 RepID=A0A6J5RY84_9CAUD|nr:hypothetical protein UFOVP1304_59 [uncultured Caudovirales phage]
MNTWSDRTPRTLAEAGIHGDISSRDERKVLYFMAGFSIGTLATLFLLIKILP